MTWPAFALPARYCFDYSLFTLIVSRQAAIMNIRDIPLITYLFSRYRQSIPDGHSIIVYIPALIFRHIHRHCAAALHNAHYQAMPYATRRSLPADADRCLSLHYYFGQQQRQLCSSPSFLSPSLMLIKMSTPVPRLHARCCYRPSNIPQ